MRFFLDISDKGVYTSFIMFKTKSKLERKLDNCNHTMELVRTLVPIAILILQVVILTELL